MARIRYDANAAQAVKAAKDLAKAQADIAKGVDAQAVAYGKAEKEGRRFLRSVETNQERYNRRLLQTAELQKRGIITQKQAAQAATELRRRYERTADAQRDAFGARAINRLVAYAAGVATIGRAVDLLKTGFQQAEAAAQKAADSAFGAISQQGELQQLTDDPQRLAKLNSFAKRLIARGVFSSEQRADAFRTAFSLESAGFSDSDKEFLADVGARRFVAPENLVGFGGRLRKAQDVFGAEDAGSIRDILDKVVVGAAQTQSDAANIAAQIPEFGKEARDLGIAFEEALAAFVKVEQEAKSPEEAATQLKNLLVQLEARDLAVGGDLTESIDAIAGRIDRGERLIDIIPNVRARSAAKTLLGVRDAAGVDTLERDILAAGGAFGRQAGQLEGVDPLFAASIARAREEGALAISREQRFGEREAIFDIVRAARTRQLEERFGLAGTAAAGIGAPIADVLGLEDFAAQRALDSGALTGESRQVVEDYLRRTAEGIENLNSNRPVTTRAE